MKTLKPRHPNRVANTRAPTRTASMVMDGDTRRKLVYHDARWAKLRRWVLELYPRCVWPGCCSEAKVLDHITPVQQVAGRRQAFSPDNVQPLCRQHHQEKTETIDAPYGDPTKYRYDLAHQSDKRPDDMRQWAAYVMEQGQHLERVGNPDANDKDNRRIHVGPISC